MASPVFVVAVFIENEWRSKNVIGSDDDGVHQRIGRRHDLDRQPEDLRQGHGFLVNQVVWFVEDLSSFVGVSESVEGIGDDVSVVLRRKNDVGH